VRAFVPGMPASESGRSAGERSTHLRVRRREDHLAPRLVERRPVAHQVVERWRTAWNRVPGQLPQRVRLSSSSVSVWEQAHDHVTSGRPSI